MPEASSPTPVIADPVFSALSCRYAEPFIRLDIRWSWKPIRAT
jgi:hypothetical protein